jgi:outer membrane receptor protein involved in Fe transport
LQSEITVICQPSQALSVVSGLEFRNGSLQASPTVNNGPNAAEEGGTGFVINGSNQIDQLDLAVYSQISYHPRRDFGVVIGGRLDYDRIRNSLGYGTVFNPRLAFVFTPKNLVFKVIYAEGFKVPSNAEKYGTAPGVNENANPDLQNEKVRNLEVVAGWEVRDHLSLALTAYRAVYSNLVALRQAQDQVCITCGLTGQFQNIGRLEVRGLQVQAEYHLGEFAGFLTYDFTSPFNANPSATGATGVSRLRVADIASHRLNAGLSKKFIGGLGLDVRSNFVGLRRTGAGTTVPTNRFGQVDAHTTTSMALTYSGSLRFGGFLRNFRVQLVVDNLFNEFYYDPGISEANGNFAGRLPQAGRAVFFRLSSSY